MGANDQPIIVANWKMNGLLLESMQMFKTLRDNILKHTPNCKVIICPPFTLLRDMAEKIPGTKVQLGGQNCHFEDHGSFTGDISARMLKDMTCEYVILGHSERRSSHNESSGMIQKKAQLAHQNKLNAIICVGETIYERENGLAEDMIKQQLEHSIPESANNNNTIIAYEPVWAIGTDKIPSEAEITKMHNFIINFVKENFPSFKTNVKVIYGGSINDKNAKTVLDCDGVSGLLVGRSSLDINGFWNIIQAA